MSENLLNGGTLNQAARTTIYLTERRLRAFGVRRELVLRNWKSGTANEAMSLWSILMGNDRKDIVVRVDKESYLAFLLNAFLGAYNRRTDVIARKDETDPEEIKALTARIKASREALDQAVHNQPQKS